MSDKYLPIKIFEKRKNYDDRSTEGGGDNRDPGFLLRGNALRDHIRDLKSNINKVRSDFHNILKKPRSLPVIMVTRLNEKAIAKSHRGRVVAALDNDGNDNVVGVLGNRQLLSVLSSEAVLDKLEETIQTDSAAVLTSSLDGIEVFRPVIGNYEEGHLEYRARLFDYNDFDQNTTVRNLFEQYCIQIGTPIQKKIRFTADMYIYRMSIDSLSKYKELCEFEGLYSLEITSPLNISLDSLSNDVMIPVKYPEEDIDYPTVGVLDTGIAPIGHLAPWLSEEEHINYPEEYSDRSHGTAVASIIEYSDELNDTDISSTDGVTLFSALIYPKQEIFFEDLVDNIREAIERNPEIKKSGICL